MKTSISSSNIVFAAANKYSTGQVNCCKYYLLSNCSAKHQLYTVTQNTSKTGLYKHKYCNELEKEKSHSPKIISILKSESPKRGIVNQIWLNFSLMRSFGQYFAKTDEARSPFRKISKS